MNYYLGIDAGGTKTLAQIIDQDGRVLGEGQGGGGNPHNQELQSVLSHLGLAVLTAQKQAEKTISAPVQTFAGTCIGMAGLDTQDDRAKVISGLRAGMISKMSAGRLLLVNDGFIGLRSGTDENYGICLISGTGANAYGINRDGCQSQAGDWGYILGDGGSGFAIGRNLLRHVMKEYDGRAEPTVLSQKVLKYLNLHSIPDLVYWVYGEDIPVRDIASLTKLFSDPEIASLPITQQVVEEAVLHQISAFQAVMEKCGLGDQPFPTVLAGGLMNLTIPDYSGKLKAAIHRITDQARVICQNTPPIAGALALGREMNQLAEDPLFQQFMVNF